MLDEKKRYLKALEEEDTNHKTLKRRYVDRTHKQNSVRRGKPGDT